MEPFNFQTNRDVEMPDAEPSSIPSFFSFPNSTETFSKGNESRDTMPSFLKPKEPPVNPFISILPTNPFAQPNLSTDPFAQTNYKLPFN